MRGILGFQKKHNTDGKNLVLTGQPPGRPGGESTTELTQKLPTQDLMDTAALHRPPELARQPFP